MRADKVDVLMAPYERPTDLVIQGVTNYVSSCALSFVQARR
jgi:hypothetical protein